MSSLAQYFLKEDLTVQANIRLVNELIAMEESLAISSIDPITSLREGRITGFRLEVEGPETSISSIKQRLLNAQLTVI